MCISPTFNTMPLLHLKERLWHLLVSKYYFRHVVTLEPSRIYQLDFYFIFHHQSEMCCFPMEIFPEHSFLYCQSDM